MKAKSISKARMIATLIFSYLLCNYAYPRQLQSYHGLSAGELESNEWMLCGRADMADRNANIYLSDSLYIENLPGREDFYIIREDSVFWTGYHVGRRLGVLADSPIFIYNRKSSHTDSIVAQYRANGLYDVNTVVQEGGDIKWCISGYGNALISPADTIHGAVLTKQIVETLPILPEIPADSEPLVRIIYRWYDSQMKMPFAIQCDDELFLDFNFDECISVEADDADGVDVERLHLIIDSASISYDYGKVTVFTDEPVSLNVYIMDVSGNIYAFASGFSTEFELDTSDLPSNQYIISIVAEADPMYTRKVLYRK